MSRRARCAVRSMPCSIATSSEPSEAGAPSQALAPALPTVRSTSPRVCHERGGRSPRPADCDRCCRCRRTAGACATRVMLLDVADQVRHALAQLAARRARRPDDARAAPVQSTTVDGGDGGRRPPSSTQQLSAVDLVGPLLDDLRRASRPAARPGRLATVEVMGRRRHASSALQSLVRRPAHGHAALRAAQPLRDAPFAAAAARA